MSYQPPPTPAPKKSLGMDFGLAISLGPELAFGLLNLVVPDGWAWLVLIGWMGLSFLVGLVLALLEGTRRFGAGLLIGAAVGSIVAAGSCAGFVAMGNFS